MNYDIAMLGHVSKDIIVDHLGVETRLLGGAVLQSAVAAARAGARLLVVTKAARHDVASLDYLRDLGLDLVVGPSLATTSILNVFKTPDHERRDTSLVSRAAPFTAADLEAGVEAKIIDLAGLFVGELPETLIEEFSSRGKIAVDAQGLLRNAEADRTMRFADWGAKTR